MKKFIVLALTVVLLLAAAAPVAADSDIRATLLMDFETGQVLMADNIDQALPPASITKLMSMYLIFEAIADGRITMADEVRASANATNLPPNASTIFLGTGEVMTVEELLRAVAIISANDAGIALAEHIAGSESAFVNMMNEKASELGMTNTSFRNSHGLHAEGHNMSARDIGILSKEVIQRFPEILVFSAQKFVRMERETRYVRQGYFDLHSTYANLIGWRNIDGLKTGWTPQAGRGITVTAEEAGRRYIVVVLGAKEQGDRDRKVRELLALGLDHYQPQIPVKAGEIIDNIEIKLAKEKEAAIITAQDVTLVMRRGETVEEFQKQIEFLPGIQAPLAKGEVVGTLSYLQNGELVTSVDLILEEDLAKANFLTRTLRFLSQTLTNLGLWIVDMIK